MVLPVFVTYVPESALFTANRAAADVDETLVHVAYMHICGRGRGGGTGAVKRACALDRLRIEINAALDGLYQGLEHLVGTRAVPAEQPPAQGFPELCLPCRRAFASRVSWSAHAARKHGY